MLLVPSIDALRELIYICESYAISHGLLYTGKKSLIMIFRLCNKCPLVVPPIRLDGTSLDSVNRVKYLGHILTDNLRDDADIERERKSLCVRANMLPRRFAGRSSTVKMTLFKAYCTFFHTGSLWVRYT